MIAGTNTLLVLVVFSGGPHTDTRAHRAEELAKADPPHLIFLTGKEFTDKQKSAPLPFAALRPSARVVTDASRTTLESCFLVARELRRLAARANVIAVTSNYHAPRVRWLLRGMLQRGCSLRIETTPDIRWRDLRTSRTARHLIRGEIVSWLYCFPIGLALNPPARTAILLVIGTLLAAAMIRKGRQ